jgi:hypothetical protein
MLHLIADGLGLEYEHSIATETSRLSRRSFNIPILEDLGDSHGSKSHPMSGNYQTFVDGYRDITHDVSRCLHAEFNSGSSKNDWTYDDPQCTAATATEHFGLNLDIQAVSITNIDTSRLDADDDNNNFYLPRSSVDDSCLSTQKTTDPNDHDRQHDVSAPNSATFNDSKAGQICDCCLTLNPECDGSYSFNGRCSNCIFAAIPCTHGVSDVANPPCWPCGNLGRSCRGSKPEGCIACIADGNIELCMWPELSPGR